MFKLTLNVTNNCNFHCKHCLREYDRKQNLDLNILEKLLKEVVPLGLVNVGVTGGEPGLHPEFPDLIQLLLKYNLRFGITTNGSLLDRYRFIAENHKKSVRYFCHSIDGPKEVHDFIRQSGAFDTAVRGVQFFVGEGLYNNIQMCLNKHNVEHIDFIFELAKELGVSLIIFTSALRTPSNSDLVLTDTEKKACVRKIHSLQKVNPIKTAIGRSLQEDTKIGFCHRFSLYDVTVNPRNELVLCCNSIRDGIVVGSLEQHSFKFLYLKTVNMVNAMLRDRATRILNKDTFEGFNTCEYCQHFFADRIR